ncbi:hypothetical protein [Rossellomorea vietnamensis]|uniref:hypothetical protein n=1 Tax=Rossellomorea vietnamensis TaxID=218284 RepID=UPI000B21F65E|nr:hypothetical protein [Rossellomorea vietnamensis]
MKKPNFSALNEKLGFFIAPLKRPFMEDQLCCLNENKHLLLQEHQMIKLYVQRELAVLL